MSDKQSYYQDGIRLPMKNDVSLFGQWIKCKDRIPEHEVDVLIYYKLWGQIMVAHIQNDEIINRGGSFWYVTAAENIGFDRNEVNFWMPLPPAPEDSK